MKDLETKVALVTGASSGIGAAIAKDLVKLGMTVIGAARRIDKLKALEKDMVSEKGIFVPYKCDLTESNEIYDMFAWIKDNHKGVDVCVNNAGSILATSLLDGDPEEWKYLMNLNVICHCLCSQLVITSLKERNLDEGHIFFICSQSGHQVIPIGFSHFYSGTKFALHAVAEGLRQELRCAKSSILVTEVSPGLVYTELLGKMPLDGLPDSGYKVNPLLPEDVATVVSQALVMPSRVEIKQILLAPSSDPPS